MKNLFWKVLDFIKEVHYIQAKLWEESLRLDVYSRRHSVRDSKGRFTRVMPNGFKSVNKF